MDDAQELSGFFLGQLYCDAQGLAEIRVCTRYFMPRTLSGVILQRISTDLAIVSRHSRHRLPQNHHISELTFYSVGCSAHIVGNARKYP